MDKMYHEEKINYMKIAAGIVGYSFDPKHLDMLVSLYELVVANKGETNLSDVIEIQSEVDKRFNNKTKSELLDKISEKTTG